MTHCIKYCVHVASTKIIVLEADGLLLAEFLCHLPEPVHVQLPDERVDLGVSEEHWEHFPF